ncbi:MAG: hypothetical protein GXY50_08020 [Syntrophomonadaceae bacterium]|nr:hypothetical protein [Syntrophomonadaceae bacterium]
MALSDLDLVELAQYSITRLDGGWFLGVARKLGVETAWEMDIEAWNHFSYVFGKKLRKDYLTDPVWPDSYVEAINIQGQLLKNEGRQITVEGDVITVRTDDCETQKMIAKAGVADCGIVTVQSYEQLAQGLFARSLAVSVQHVKNLNQGDDCCEVIIKLKTV